MRSSDQVWNQLINFEELSKLIYIDKYTVVKEINSLTADSSAEKDLFLLDPNKVEIYVKLTLKDLLSANKMILGQVRKISQGKLINEYFFSIDLVEISKISCMVFFQSKFNYYLPMKFVDYFEELNLSALKNLTTRISEKVAIDDNESED